jgi:hypothetical protein
VLRGRQRSYLILVVPMVATDTASFFRHYEPIRLKEHVSVDGKFLPSGNPLRAGHDTGSIGGGIRQDTIVPSRGSHAHVR